MSTVSVLGSGWLGLGLISELHRQKISVKASTTTQARLSEIETQGAIPYLIKLDPNFPSSQMDFLNADVLVINIPPSSYALEQHFQQMASVVQELETKSVLPKVLFVSSLSVYGENQGDVDEDSDPKPTKDSGKVLLEVETMLQEHLQEQVTILRFGGLIDNERHPVFHLAGKKGLSGGNGYIHLIHKQDCLGLILQIFKLAEWGRVFNGVAEPVHTKAVFYTELAAKLNLAPPQYESNENWSRPRRVHSEQTRKVLKYEFQFPDLSTFVPRKRL